MTDKWVRRWQIPSVHTPGKFHIVAIDKDGNWGCDCWPWKKSNPRIECDHIRWVKANLAEEGIAEIVKPKPDEAPFWLYEGQFPDGTKRWHLLYLDPADHTWKNAPYFIDRNPRQARAGEKPYSLHGSGMGEPCWLAGGKRSAGKFGWHHTLAEAKKAGLALFDEDKAKNLI